ncbi:MAG: TMEM198/TM7SF3 family protein [Clostridia bacterium]|nr:TMEM198/TM7SF3 family protein [Clostridia bacterium]
METVIITIDRLVEIVSIVIGVLFCFFGYKSFKASITCAGVAIGYQIGAFIVRWIEIYTGNPMENWIALALKIVFAIFMGLFAFKFYKKSLVMSVMLFVARLLYSAILVGTGSKDVSRVNQLIALGICLLVGLVVGILALNFQRVMIIVLTSIGGAMILSDVAIKYLFMVEFVRKLASSLVFKLFNVNPTPEAALSGVLVIILAVCGLVCQFKSTPRR